MYRKNIYFTVNGQIVELGGKEALAPLSDTLRYFLGKTGTKVVCAEGDCGACTVMLARADEGVFRSINSCIYPTFSVDGCHLVTVEGLAKDSNLHEVQQSMVRNFGGQCGFCTPGFVMSIVNLYEHKSEPTEKTVKNYLTGNLCRCTGYQPIISAALDVDIKKCEPLRSAYALNDETEFLLSKSNEAVLIEIGEQELFAPITMQQAVEYKSRRTGARLFSGATDLGVQINKGKEVGHKRLSLHLIKELNQITETETEFRIGARVTLAHLQKRIASHAPAFSEFLNIFASPQIKNSATLVGNLANGSPIADTTPFLMAMGAKISLFGPSGGREISVGSFFKGYKSFDMSDEEIITAVTLPLGQLRQFKIGCYKISQRRDLDISCMNACFAFLTDGEIVKDVRVTLGGVGPTTLRLFEVEKILIGQKLSKILTAKGADKIAESIAPLSDARGTADFRHAMAKELFHKYLQEHFSL